MGGSRACQTLGIPVVELGHVFSNVPWTHLLPSHHGQGFYDTFGRELSWSVSFAFQLNTTESTKECQNKKKMHFLFLGHERSDYRCFVQQLPWQFAALAAMVAVLVHACVSGGCCSGSLISVANVGTGPLSDAVFPLPSPRK